ncbi:MAG: hypothetical protein QXK90_02570 [Candidatus Parvarchaeota archaeon]
MCRCPKMKNKLETEKKGTRTRGLKPAPGTNTSKAQISLLSWD